MSNSTTHLDQISASQAGKEAIANALFDAGSPAMLYGRLASTTAALTWGYYGGMVLIAGEPTWVANGIVTLEASTTNYLEADPATGAVSVNSTEFTTGYTQLYEIVAGASTVTSYTDKRTLASVAGTSGDPAGTAADLMDAHEAAANPHPTYLTQAEGDALYAAVAQPFDLTVFYPGVPTASAIFTRVPVARVVSFPASLTGSYAKARVAATAQTDFDVQKNGVSVGTIRFAAAATTATFVGVSAFSTAAGDILSIHAPASADATLADIGIVLTGTR